MSLNSIQFIDFDKIYFWLIKIFAFFVFILIKKKFKLKNEKDAEFFDYTDGDMFMDDEDDIVLILEVSDIIQ